MRPHLSRGVTTAFIITLSLVGIPSTQPQNAQPSMVRGDAARIEDVQEKREVAGSLRASSRARVAAMEEGLLVEIAVDEADSVKKGDLIARVDDRRLKAQLDGLQAQKRVNDAQIEARKAELENAQWNLDRLRPLFKQEQTTEQALRAAEMQVQVKENDLAAARREVERIDSQIDLFTIRIGDTRVTAPFDAMVVERQAEPGEWITPGAPLVTLISTHIIEAWMEAPEEFAALSEDQLSDLRIQVSALNQTLPAQRVRVIPQVDPRVRTIYIVADLQMDVAALKPGMSLTAWLPTGERKPRLTVDKDALLRGETGFYVMKAQPAQEGHIAVPVSVTRCFETGDRVVVEAAGLSDGDIVVVEGNERLRPMTPIQLLDGSSK
ncbi:MAG: efflux RND transporter periplasmic adaptor subunit [bacterium]|nr:efflux RND transporter periplasmic adaptor subunit [bacterium]